MSIDLSKKSVLVTGGAGFLGSFVVEALQTRGATRIVVPRRRDFDLVDAQAVRRLLDSARPDVIIHLAAQVGGIGANQRNPGRFFYENLMMGVHLIEESRRLGLEKFVQIGTVCAYPKFAAVPFREDDLWSGFPEETNAPYGIAKKALLVQLQAYRAQYGFESAYLLPVNLYGPRDNFDLESSHVIPALIRKMLEGRAAGSPSVSLWGDGSPTREFLHVRDAAEGIVLATEHYAGDAPVNLGSGEEHSIRELAGMIAEACGYQGRLEWDSSRPNGQPRRKLDTSRAFERFGFRARIPFSEGIRETIEWYQSTRRG